MSYEILKNLNGKTVPETSNDFDKFFTKFAEEYKPKSFTEMQDMVKQAYDKYEIELKEWAEKISLDKNKIKKIFVNE